MIDIHHHCIPGIDDGPRTMAEAVDLCRRAADDGIVEIIATPHVLRSPWNNRSSRLLQEALERLREAVGDTPRLRLGSEYYFQHDVAEVLRSGDGIVPLAGSKYFLFEFDTHTVPPLVDQPLFRVQLEGWTPIIAHPERNAVLRAKPELLEHLVEAGAKVQITAGSVAGDFGADAERASLEWIERRMVHFVASDAHNTTKRPPRMTVAREIIRRVAGEDVATALTETNPASVIDHRPLAFDPEPRQAPPRRGFMKTLRKFIQA